MAYELGWGTRAPGHIVCLLDLSESMKTDDKIGKGMDAMQRIFRFLLERCCQGKVFMNRFTATIIGYNSAIVPLLTGGVQELFALIKDSNICGKPLFDYGEGGIAEPIGQMCMTKAFNEARKDIVKWINEANGRNLPVPIVVNISDGQLKENNKSFETCASEALLAAQRLKEMQTPDGNVLLYNLYIGKSDNSNEIFLPSEPPQPTGNELEDKGLQFLFESSSLFPEELLEAATAFDLPACKGSRTMSSTAEVVRLFWPSCYRFGLQ